MLDSVFIWVGKCAGTSIANFCEKSGIAIDPRNLTHYKILGYVDSTDLDCFKFSFVRNPWDRVVSSYAMFTSWRKPGWIEPLTFREFVDICSDNANVEKRPFRKELWEIEGLKELITREDSYQAYVNSIINHTVPFTHPFYNIVDEQGKQKIDFIGRYENIHQDFEQLKKIIGCSDIDLEHVNKSKRQNLQLYYDEYTREKVAKIFKQDIDMFKYQFPK
jgi:hypothetical protein